MAQGSGRYVLVVEDQPPMRSVLRRFLCHHGFEVINANDGAEAIWYLNSQKRICAVVTDYALPGMSGLEILQQIRAQRTAVPHGLPVLLVTAYTELAIVQTAQALGADAIIAKPFSLSCFHERLLHALDTRPKHASPKAYAEILLPVAQRSAAHDGERASPGVVLTRSRTRSRAQVSPAAGPDHRIPIAKLEPGMVLAQPIHSPTGQLLAGAGLALQAHHIARIQQVAEGESGYDFIRIAPTSP